MDINDRIQRIVAMEVILDKQINLIESLSENLKDFAAHQVAYETLIRYYESEDWRLDLAADDAGLVPTDLKRGVLSEDAIYNSLIETADLIGMMKELVESSQEEA